MNETKKIKTKSEAKIRANKRNSLKSTGPKSKKGKGIVKWNAMKHGLLSKEIVIDAGCGEEDEKEFNTLQSQLHEELKPVGIVEEMLVEKIAVCYWRLRRVIRCEIGEIRKQLDTACWDIVFKRADEHLHDRKYIIFDDSKEKLRRSSMGLQYLIGILKDVRSEIEEDGHFCQETRKMILDNFYTEKGSPAFMILFFNHMVTDGQRLSEEDPEKFGESIDPKKAKAIMLKTIDDEVKTMEKFKKKFEEFEGWQSNANCLSLHLPDKVVLDKTLRYETTIERQFYRALHELIRLQSARLGGNPPAPLAIDVDISKES